MSSTPNHSFVPSVAIAAVEERIAGMKPAAAAMAPLVKSPLTALRAVGATSRAIPKPEHRKQMRGGKVSVFVTAYLEQRIICFLF